MTEQNDENVFPVSPAAAVKLGATVIIGSCVKDVIKGVIKSNTPTSEDDSRITKAKLYVGTYVISAFIADKVVDYADKRIDRNIKSFQQVKAWFNKRDKNASPWDQAIGFFQNEPATDISSLSFDSVGIPVDLEPESSGPVVLEDGPTFEELHPNHPTTDSDI